LDDLDNAVKAALHRVPISKVKPDARRARRLPAMMLCDSCRQSAAYPQQIVNSRRSTHACGQLRSPKEKLMNAAKSVAAVEKPLTTTLSTPLESRAAAERGSTASQRAKPHVHADTEAEKIPSTLARMTAKSFEELEGLVAELQEVREFVKSEGERVQREIANYTQLNQSAWAAVKIISETIGPWKSTAIDGEAQSSTSNSEQFCEEKGSASPGAIK
jgi:hypothetical protein